MAFARIYRPLFFGLTAFIPVGVFAAPSTTAPVKSAATPALNRTGTATAALVTPPLNWPPAFVEKTWKQVKPVWHRAYVLSYRSPDLLSYDPDERWGRNDGRLESGGILTEFPEWLKLHGSAIKAAREQGRPILLSLHFHSGYGVGIVSYTPDLLRGEAATYPWLIRQLIAAGLNTPDVTIALDTCNGQATSAHQLRPDLIPGGVESFPPFAAWRRADPKRRNMPRAIAYQRFTQSRVSDHLGGSAKGRSANVRAVPLEPLTAEERASFKANLYGQRGVILATPSLFNLLRLGPGGLKGSNTANLMKDRVDTVWVGGYLKENNAEFRQFREFGFLANAGPGPIEVIYEPGHDPASVAARHRPRSAEVAEAETPAAPAAPGQRAVKPTRRP